MMTEQSSCQLAHAHFVALPPVSLLYGPFHQRRTVTHSSTKTFEYFTARGTTENNTLRQCFHAVYRAVMQAHRS